jgi:hypothetical protein
VGLEEVVRVVDEGVVVVVDDEVVGTSVTGGGGTTVVEVEVVDGEDEGGPPGDVLGSVFGSPPIIIARLYKFNLPRLKSGGGVGSGLAAAMGSKKRR